MPVLGTVPLGIYPLGTSDSGSTPVVVEVPAGSMALATFTPSVPLAAPGPAALTIATYPPLAGVLVSVFPPTGTLQLAGFAPSVGLAATIPVPAGSLVLSGQVPGIVITLTIDQRHQLSYGISFARRHAIDYGIGSLVAGQFSVSYAIDDSEVVSAQHQMVYAVSLAQNHGISYGFNAVVEAHHDTRYDMSQEVTQNFEINFSIDNFNRVVRRHRMIYPILSTSVINISGQVRVII